jgi:predicted DNA-binding WGR domain protein
MHGNERFTFRVWLVGLGLKGPEFKTARRHLTANLRGNSAWRHGQPATRRRRAATQTRAPAAAGSALNTVYLENRNDGHHKFYRIEWNGCLAVRTVWGRIGTEGRSKEERFEDDAALEAYVESTLRTRLRHGYSVISDTRQGR